MLNRAADLFAWLGSPVIRVPVIIVSLAIQNHAETQNNKLIIFYSTQTSYQ